MTPPLATVGLTEIYAHPSSTEAFNEVLGTIVRADEPRLART
jgi:hypothetical protein